MLHNFCEFATDYPKLLRSLRDPQRLRENERVVQFPFLLPTAGEKTEEEVARLAEKRKEQGKKLQEMAARTRMEKACVPRFQFHLVLFILGSIVQLMQQENELQQLLILREDRGDCSKREWMVHLSISNNTLSLTKP